MGEVFSWLLLWGRAAGASTPPSWLVPAPLTPGCLTKIAAMERGLLTIFFFIIFLSFFFLFFFFLCSDFPRPPQKALAYHPTDVARKPWLQNISGMAVGSVVQSPSTYGNHREILLKRGSGPIHHSSRSHVPLSGRRALAGSAGGPEAPGAFPPRGCSTTGMGRMGPLCWHPAAQSRSVVLPVVSCHCLLLSSIWWCCCFSATGQNLGGCERSCGR